MNNLPKRKPTRLKHYNYSANGAYFITICTKNKQKILGQISGTENPAVHLSEYGKIAEKYLRSANKMKHITLDKYVIMPNHIHMILSICANSNDTAPSPASAALPLAISAFKRLVQRAIGKTIFQRSYHDHIIRNKADYQKIWEYIDTNPTKWEQDCFYDAKKGL